MAYVRAILIIAICTGISGWFRSTLDPLNVVMIFLLGTILIAAVSGPKPAILSSIIGIGILDYFFIPPYGTLYIYEGKYISAFATMFLASIIITVQAERLRRNIVVAKTQEKKAISLSQMAQELSSSYNNEQIANIAEEHIGKAFSGTASVFTLNSESILVDVLGKKIPDQKEFSTIEWAFKNNEITGYGTKTTPASQSIYIPLVAENNPLGVLEFTPAENKTIKAENLNSLQSFISTVAAALDRIKIAGTAEKNKVEAEGERSRNLLLSSISHDLRTPLASIIGASENLSGKKLSPEDKELAASINQEAVRLAKTVNNILEVTRLESDNLKLDKQPYFIEEIIGSALEQSKVTASFSLQKEFPLVNMDGMLIEQVLVNLLENAIKYGGDSINVSGKYNQSDITIQIADNGQGIDSAIIDKIFDKFYSGKKGTGLGLAICKTIIHAHNGTIRAENLNPGGAAFTFTLPIDQDE